MWGMGLESGGVEVVGSCRGMIKAFMVFPGVYSLCQNFDIKMAYSPFVWRSIGDDSVGLFVKAHNVCGGGVKRVTVFGLPVLSTSGHFHAEHEVLDKVE